MKIIEKSEDKISFSEEMNESLANAIRRSSLEIPILAIDEIEFIKNDSVLYDEVLALRFGLIPLKMEKDMVLQEKCSCKGKGCSKCQIQLKLQAKGPCTVYAKDLKGKAEVVYEEMPAVVLVEEQELELIATAKLGKGIEHTKFSPGLVYYRNVAEIEIKEMNKELAEKCFSVCPKKVFEIDKDKLKIKNIYNCDLCEACVEACKMQNKEEAIKISPGKEIIFNIEPWGQISAREILEGAVKALKENLKIVEKESK